MNVYLLALLALIAAFAIGFLVYGQLFKKPLGIAGEKPDPQHLVMATVGLYITSLGAVYLYGHVIIGTLTGVTKGALLGILLGTVIFAIPLYIDSTFLKSKKEGLQAVIFNWILSFLVMGVVIGLLH